MKWIYVLILFIILIVGTWYFRGGSLDILPGLSGNNYSALAPYIKNLPFAVYVPKYIPASFTFQEKESAELQRGTNIGVPQFNLLFSRRGGEDALAFRQFDRMRYKSDVLVLVEKVSDFALYFKERLKLAPTVRDGKEIYVSMSKERKKTVFGELEYMAAGYFLRDDSLIQVNYSGKELIAEEEIIKIILSIEPF